MNELLLALLAANELSDMVSTSTVEELLDSSTTAKAVSEERLAEIRQKNNEREMEILAKLKAWRKNKEDK